MKKSEYDYLTYTKKHSVNWCTKDPQLFNSQQILTEEQIIHYRAIIDNENKQNNTRLKIVNHNQFSPIKSQNTIISQ